MEAAILAVLVPHQREGKAPLIVKLFTEAWLHEPWPDAAQSAFNSRSTTYAWKQLVDTANVHGVPAIFFDWLVEHMGWLDQQLDNPETAEKQQNEQACE